MNKEEREEHLSKLCGTEEGRELLRKYWEWCPDTLEVNVSMFWVNAFIGWLENEGLEITPKEFHGIH